MTAKRPTILQIVPRLDTGGAELSTVEIATAVVRAGGRALVASEGGRLEADIAKAGGELIRLPASTKNPARILANASRLAKIIAEEGVDLVHARSRAPAWSALNAARRTGRPFVTTYHGIYREQGRFKRLYNSVMARGDIVIANSRYTADLIRARYGTPEARIRVIYRGVDGRRFDPRSVAAERVDKLRKLWGLEPGQRAILHAARLTRWKGQSVLIAAAARLLQDGGWPNDPIFILAGDAQGRTDYAERVTAEIAAAGLNDRVRLVGHVEDMPAAFLAAQLAVVASIEPEAFGRAAIEAQVMGCPVISTEIGAPPETVLAEPAAAPLDITGWLVPPSDAEALAEAMGKALTLSAPARAAMGERARAHALQRFSTEAMQRQTLSVYDELIGSHLTANWLGGRS